MLLMNRSPMAGMIIQSGMYILQAEMSKFTF